MHRRKKKKANRESEKTKGLRLFSLKVCEKVEQKRRTTYNEVADEVVDEVCRGMIEIESTSKNISTEHKNIRRRVYDALNVLRAMGIISKEKKEIRWIGLPSSASPRKLTSSPLYDVDSLEVSRVQSKFSRNHLTKVVVSINYQSNIGGETNSDGKDQEKERVVQRSTDTKECLHEPDSTKCC